MKGRKITKKDIFTAAKYAGTVIITGVIAYKIGFIYGKSQSRKIYVLR